MPDIAKCKGSTCPLRDGCYRFLAEPSSDRQATWADIPYGKIVPGHCDFYMPVKQVEEGLKT